MKYILLLCLLATSGYSQTSESDCSKKQNLIQHGVILKDLNLPCPEDPCNETSQTLNSNESCPNYCGMFNGTCISKALPPNMVPDVIIDPSVFTQAVVDQFSSNISKVTRRQFNTLQGPIPGVFPPAPLPTGFVNANLPPFGTPDVFNSLLAGGYGCQRNVFPFNCPINYHNPSSFQNLLTPLVNIPYCYRIACRNSDPNLEINPQACMSKPGCYYDQDLAFLRQAFSFALLPGVPVCYLAITNTNFQRLAHDYTVKSGQTWNPIYTKCLIDANTPAIESPDPGCYSLRLLQYIGVFPKIAGWRGISRRECSLINGCWLSSAEGYQCFHPGEVDRVQVQAGEDPFSSVNPQANTFGLPICRPFQTDSPQNYIKSYYQCKQSGCVVDPSVNAQALNKQFLELTLSNVVPPFVKPYFWQRVMSGSIRPRNWEEEFQKLIQGFRFPFRGGVLGGGAGVQFNSIYFSSLQPYSLRVTGRNLNPNQPDICSLYCANIDTLTGLPPGPVRPPPFPVFPPAYGATIALPGLQRSTPLGVNLPQLANPLLPHYCLCPPPQPQCPYRQPFSGGTHGFPTLKGSFEGCCEKHLCYIPRGQTSLQRSGISTYYSEYSEWTACTVTCGGGIQNRTRVCETSKFGKDGIEDKSACDKVTLQTRDCNRDPCPSWGAYGPFSSCSVTCGTGSQTRARICQIAPYFGPNVGCVGNSTETRSCTRQACPVFGPWSRFSKCCCGRGFQTRRRRCLRNCPPGLRVEMVRKRCVRFCGVERQQRLAGRCQERTCSVVAIFQCRAPSPRPKNACDRPKDRPTCPDFKRRKRIICYTGRCRACLFTFIRSPPLCVQSLQG